MSPEEQQIIVKRYVEAITSHGPSCAVARGYLEQYGPKTSVGRLLRRARTTWFEDDRRLHPELYESFPWVGHVVAAGVGVGIGFAIGAAATGFHWKVVAMAFLGILTALIALVVERAIIARRWRRRTFP